MDDEIVRILIAGGFQKVLGEKTMLGDRALVTLSRGMSFYYEEPEGTPTAYVVSRMEGRTTTRMLANVGPTLLFKDRGLQEEFRAPLREYGVPFLFHIPIPRDWTLR